jgi:plasmid stabilization system protein ParE
MKIKLDEEFENNFEKIFKHIAKDKISASKNFKKELFKQIKNIPNFPYKYRQSIYFEDEKIRDMIFKGYTIVYKVDTQENTINIVDQSYEIVTKIMDTDVGDHKVNDFAKYVHDEVHKNTNPSKWLPFGR